MTTDEAAARLGIEPVSVRQAIARGTLRATKHGRDYWITEAAVADYEARHKGRVGRPAKGEPK